MTLIIIRHAIAVPAGTEGIADDERPLTKKGRRRFAKAARGLAQVCPRPDVLLTSPLPRAAETADIAAEAWTGPSPTPEPTLAHGSADDIIAMLARYAGDQRVVVVGHEPTMSTVLARIMGSPAGERFAFRKGGAAMVDVPGVPAEGGRLEWFMRPKLLRALG
jgi:phosphohistidine phosphatase